MIIIRLGSFLPTWYYHFEGSTSSSSSSSSSRLQQYTQNAAAAEMIGRYCAAKQRGRCRLLLPFHSGRASLWQLLRLLGKFGNCCYFYHGHGLFLQFFGFFRSVEYLFTSAYNTGMYVYGLLWGALSDEESICDSLMVSVNCCFKIFENI